MNYRVTSTCRHCGGSFSQPKCRVWRDKFCSPWCGNRYRMAKMAARTRQCATCGKEFTPRARQLSSGVGKFCSQRCNQSRLAALNTKEARERCVATRKANLAAGTTVLDKGDKHWRWRGGEKATRARRTLDGRQAAALRKYRHSHPEKAAEWGHARRAEHIGRIAKGTVARLLKLQDGRCIYCAEEIPPYHLDHKTPVARGGKNNPENLHLTCPRCNLRKNTLTHEEFLVSKRRRTAKNGWLKVSA